MRTFILMLGIFLLLCGAGSIWVAYSFGVTGSGDLFNTDLIQPYMIVRDTFIHPGSLLAWQYSPANYVFPDTVVAGALYVFGVPWLSQPIAYAGVTLAAYAVLMGWVAEVVRSGSGVAVAVLSALIIAAFLAGAAASVVHTGSLLAIYLVSSYIHTGALIMGLAASALALFCLSRSEHKSAFRWLVALSVVSAYSDLLFLIWFVAPVSFVWFLVARARSDRSLRKEGIILVVASVLGNVLDKVTRAPHGLERDYQATLANLWQAFVVGPLSGDWVMAIVSVSMIVMAGAAVPSIWKLMKGKEISSLHLALLILAGVQWCAVLAPAVSGQLVYIAHLRYALPIFLLPILWTLLLVVAVLTPRARQSVAGASAAAIAIGSASTFGAGVAAAQTLTQPLPVVSCIMNIGRTSGYSDYWLSKLTTFSSDYRMSVVPLLADGSLHRPSINLRWLDTTADGKQPFAPDFIVMERLDPTLIEARFGRPAKMVTCGSTEVWLYDRALPVERP